MWVSSGLSNLFPQVTARVNRDAHRNMNDKITNDFFLLVTPIAFLHLHFYPL